MAILRVFIVLIGLWAQGSADSHPLRLSLCEIEHSSKKQELSITLKLFLTDVNEALVFDSYSKELAFCEPNESPKANDLLLSYLNEFFIIKVNGQMMNLNIKRKELKGEGDNTALWLYFKYSGVSVVKTLEVKNAVFTDLFDDQNNIIYVHMDEESESMMLNKKQPSHQLKF
ncbi:MAG: DUF6702 family protein [Bacteroidota bacterium]